MGLQSVLTMMAAGRPFEAAAKAQRDPGFEARLDARRAELSLLSDAELSEREGLAKPSKSRVLRIERVALRELDVETFVDREVLNRKPPGFPGGSGVPTSATAGSEPLAVHLSNAAHPSCEAQGTEPRDKSLSLGSPSVNQGPA